MRFAAFAYLWLCTSAATAVELDVWIGTAEPRGNKTPGIYYLTFDDETGKLSASTLAAKQKGAGFLALHPTLPVLYSTGNGVSSWQISGGTNSTSLERINSQPTGDGGAAHIAVDRTGGALFSAQYGGGSVTSYPLANNGAIGERRSLIKHDEPSHVVENRQQSCHPHWVGISPDNRFLLVPDLGADRVYVHQFEASTAKLTKHTSAATPSGGGPRHFKFHPQLPVGYLVNELSMSLSVLDYDAQEGRLSLRQTVPTLSPQQKAGERFNSGSEVRVHPSGKFVYSANRGHDSISVFSVTPATGDLLLIEQEPIRGSWPRNFNLDPSGRWLLAAGRDSNTLAVFEIDQENGTLQYTREIAEVPAPICVLITPR